MSFGNITIPLVHFSGVGTALALVFAEQSNSFFQTSLKCDFFGASGSLSPPHKFRWHHLFALRCAIEKPCEEITQLSPIHTTQIQVF